VEEEHLPLPLLLLSTLPTAGCDDPPPAAACVFEVTGRDPAMV